MNPRGHPLPKTVVLLRLCLWFVGMGGLYGGIAFLIDPTGALLGMPPITDYPVALPSYQLPGLFLLGVMGIVPLGLAWLAVPRAATLHLLSAKDIWSSTVLFGVVLLGWLLLQSTLIGFNTPIQWILLGVALLLLLLCHSPTVKRYYATA